MSKKLVVPILLIVIIGAVFVLSQTPETPIENNEPNMPDEPESPEEPPVEPEAPAETPVDEPEGILRGVSLSPASFESEDFLGFFQLASDSGDFVSWVGDVASLDSEQSPTKVMYAMADQYGFEVMVITGYFNQESGEVLHVLDEVNRQDIIDSLTGYVEDHSPDYLGFGVEVNTFATSNPEGFSEYVSFYDEVYTATKEASPSTKVFPVFQLEHMKGLDGGLFGGENDPDAHTWAMLDDFEFDLAVFTTYPCLIFKEPSEIPANYYTEITEYTSKPVAFTEMGWFREGFTGWESSVEEQAKFIDLFFETTSEMPVEFVTWSFLYDPDAQVPFDQMGILAVGEESSAALDAWKMR